jgi:2-polyprenyl-3-methyl-5-hydroxy-6-metoxy-1,4-benzoquinol methylase
MLKKARNYNSLDLIDFEIKKLYAFESLDNLFPKGALTSICNKGFLLSMESRIHDRPIQYLDLGCAQGALVKAARELGWLAYGIDGAEVTTQQCAWIKNGDITEPIVTSSFFDLITAWEVLEHIPEDKLCIVFDNVIQNLRQGGYFIATTSNEEELHQGVDLYVTKKTNEEWKRFIRNNYYDQLKEVDLKLKPYQYARQNFKNPSFLVYERI